eukprot:jgi/Orpsp1_1/1178659/evm.model.c7180000066251.1
MKILLFNIYLILLVYGAFSRPYEKTSKINNSTIVRNDDLYDINVKKIQNRLIDLGYSCGPNGADGYYGNGTVFGVYAFKEVNNITDRRGIPHGQEIDAKTQALLFSPDAKPNKVNGEENHSTLSTHSVLEFRRLLSNSEDHENKEKVRLVSNSKKFENEERVSFIKRLQTRLLLLGYDCGNLDGVMSPMMESCIRDFQEKNKLEKKDLMVTGKMDEATYNVLFSVDAINYGKT